MYKDIVPKALSPQCMINSVAQCNFPSLVRLTISNYSNKLTKVGGQMMQSVSSYKQVL